MPDPQAAAQQAQAHFERLSAFIKQEWWNAGALPRNMDEIEDRWTSLRPAEPVPLDPFDGLTYGYSKIGTSYRLWSSGPDRESGTRDDLRYEWSPPQR